MRAEAEQALLQFLARRPQEGAARFQLARFYEFTGDRRRALDQYRTYLALHPDDKNRAMIEQRITQLSAAPPNELMHLEACRMITASGRIRHSVYYSIIDFEWPAVRDGLLEKLNRPYPSS